jgi:hypothetical protein
VPRSELPDDPDERFAAAARTPHAAPAHAATAHMLATAAIVGVGRIVYSSNATFLLELDGADAADAERPLRAVYKPARGERPLWDFPRRTLHFREVAAYLVDAALGFDLIPPTVLRDGPAGPGSIQLFVHALERALSEPERESLQPQLQAMAALDALINNADRKSAHLLIGESLKLYAIDNALSFLPYPRQRTVLLELGGSALPDDVAAAVIALQGDERRRRALRRRLQRLLSAEEVEAFFARLQELAGDPVYPRLDPWDGRPFEWW